MSEKEYQNVLGNLIDRQVLFRLLKIEYAREPYDENGIKLCDEQIAILESKITDIILNGTGEKQPIGILNASRSLVKKEKNGIRID